MPSLLLNLAARDHSRRPTGLYTCWRFSLSLVDECSSCFTSAPEMYWVAMHDSSYNCWSCVLEACQLSRPACTYCVCSTTTLVPHRAKGWLAEIMYVCTSEISSAPK